MTDDGSAVLTVADDLRWVEVDGEVVTCDDHTGACSVLTGSSAVVFAHLDGTASLDEVAGRLSALSGADHAVVRRDVLHFATTLEHAGLLRRTGQGGRRAG
jgi:hypothetical protein